MKITVYGLGYVGLTSATCFAEVGHDVLCYDINAKKVEELQNGKLPIYEPGLEALIQKNYAAGHLQFTADIEQAIHYAEIQLIAVGTPCLQDGSIDLSQVCNVAKNIAERMTANKTIVIKSTVAVGTCDKIKSSVNNILAQRQITVPFFIAFNPEFLKEGDAVNDFMRPDRIIIGADNSNAESLLKRLYQPFNRNHDRVLVMDIRSAELTKYAANAMLATKISFINEMANLAELFGADIEQVRRGIGSDPRIGYDFIYPGCGYGGSCFPKDIRSLIQTAATVDFDMILLRSVEAVNNKQKQRLFQKISNYFNGELQDKVFAIWGLAFKPNTDDLREASSIELIRVLQAAGAKIQAYDPGAMNRFQQEYSDFSNIVLTSSKEEALEKADALVICTEWQNFRAPDLRLVKEMLRNPIIFDGRNLYDPALLKQQGFEYYGIGRGQHSHQKLSSTIDVAPSKVGSKEEELLLI